MDNWTNEGYIKARLDRFFGAIYWLVENEKAIVQHVARPTSDHCILILDTKPELRKQKRRFYFDKRWGEKPGVEEMVRKAWEAESIGSPMFKVASKIKRCRMES